MYRFHAPFPNKARPRVRQCAPEHRDSVVDTARIAMKDLFGDERPFIDFFRNVWRYGFAAVMGKIHVTGVFACGRLAGGR